MTPKAIIEDAKRDSRKGNYRVYEQYKQRLLQCWLSPSEYSDYCVLLAKALRV